jgi:hypothetical protein
LHSFTLPSYIINYFFIVAGTDSKRMQMYRSAKILLANHFGLLGIAVAAFAVLWNLMLRSEDVERMSMGVWVWWTTLCAVSIANICGWRISAALLAGRKASAPPAVYLFQRRQLTLSAVYVAGCAFRSILPRADVQRISLLDSWASSVLVGRSVATIAELCFVAQLALLLHTLATDARAWRGVVLSWLLVPLIFIAEICSWYSVLTTSYIGNMLEESIWTLTAALVVGVAFSLWIHGVPAYRPFLAGVMVLGVAYVAFMCLVDVPMYASRWLADEACGRQYLSLAQGFADVRSRWVVTFDWDEWRTEIPWMSLYFSAGVWCSIALVHSLRLAQQPKLDLNGGRLDPLLVEPIPGR